MRYVNPAKPMKTLPFASRYLRDADFLYTRCYLLIIHLIRNTCTHAHLWSGLVAQYCGRKQNKAK